MRIAKKALPLAAAAALVTSLSAGRAEAQGALLGDLGKNLLGFAGGTALTRELNNLGVFAAIGLGSGPDPQTLALLNQIIGQLNTIQSDIGNLTAAVANLNATVIQQSTIDQLHAILLDMDDAQSKIQTCAQDVALVAMAPGTAMADMQLQTFAQQIAGLSAGACDPTTEFNRIHTRMVGDPSLGPADVPVYTLLARMARTGPIPFTALAGHFIQYSLTQRKALNLIRSAYTALGEPAILQTLFAMPPTDFSNKLRDEEAAFLQAVDAYVTAGPPPYDPSPVALGDAIVQRLEGDSSQATSFSLSIFDDAPKFVPALLLPDPNGIANPMTIAMSDVVQGAALTYYNMPNTELTAGIASCLSATPVDGFSYLERSNFTRGYFTMGSSCKLRLERHLSRNVPLNVDTSWKESVRGGSVPVTINLRNAATLADETAADALALGGDPSGAGSGFSSFTLVPGAMDPSTVSLAIDLPGQPGALIGAGSKHPFVAGGGMTASFTKVPAGPQYPDRFALMSGGQYLSVGSDGYAALAAAPSYFDFVTTLDGGTELDYKGGVLYVDSQYRQIFHGESPDDIWANSVNLAQPAAIPWWNVGNNGPSAPRTAPTTSLPITLPCLSPTGAYEVGMTPVIRGSPCPGLCYDSSRCSDTGLPYVEYQVTLFNANQFPRAFQLFVAGQATGVTSVGTTPYTGSSQAGLHCYGAGTDHLDTGAVTVAAGATNTTGESMYNNITVPAAIGPIAGQVTIICQALDLVYEPAHINISDFTVKPCQGMAGGTCTVYQ
jgi:hypothetical protein